MEKLFDVFKNDQVVLKPYIANIKLAGIQSKQTILDLDAVCSSI